MTNEHMPDFLKMLLSKNNTELTDDMLEKVSGGVMTTKAEKDLMAALKLGKSQNYDKKVIKDMANNYFPMFSPQYPGVTLEDVLLYIDDNWDSI